MEEKEIDLRELLKVIWDRRVSLLTIVFIGSLFSVIYSISLPNMYSASALLAPSGNSGGLGDGFQQYSGLAGLAGISLPGNNQASKSDIAIEVMQSRIFVEKLISRHKILPQLIAAEYWDDSARELVLDPEQYDEKNGKWVREVDPPKKLEPSAQEAHEALRAITSIEEDKETTFVTLRVEHQSPVFAKNLVTWMVNDVNEMVRQKEIEQAKESIEYLRRQASDTSLADLEQVLFELIQSQIQKMMLAEVRRDYVFETLDPAVVAELKTGPSRSIISISGLLLSVFIAVIYVFSRFFFEERRLFDKS